MTEANTLTVGSISFDYPPVYQKKESSRAGLTDAFTSFLVSLEKDQRYRVVDPKNTLRSLRKDAEGISTPEELARVTAELKSAGIDCLIIPLKNWTRVSLVTRLIRILDVPTALVAVTTGGKSGITAATAVSASLREVHGSGNSDLTERFLDTESDEIRTWLAGISPIIRLRKSRLLSFGGSYGADIPFTRVDQSELESRFVSEILTEQEMVIIERAREIVSREKKRITRFIEWLENRGVKVQRDGAMITDESLAFQAAMYLAVRDRLRDMTGENIKGISVKCHFEVSTTCIGCTMCMIPAFLPFGTDSEGDQQVVPVACEGDLLGLLGLVLLHTLRPDVPPLFGDFVSYKESHLLLRNCGASSVYWAGRSLDPEVSLSKVELLPNIHGKSGAAVHYETPACDTVTVARLFRLRGRYHLYYGLAEILPETGTSSYSDPWPHTRLKFDATPNLLFKTAPCNHTSITEGDFTRELDVFCRYTGIKGVRCDSDSTLLAYLNDIQGGSHDR